MFKKLLDRLLPWRRPPISPEDYRRAKAMMYGAGAGPSVRADGDGVVRVAVEEVADDNEKGNG